MAFGTINYNDYLFGELSETRVTIEPVYDDSGRSVLFNRYTMTVKSVIVADPGDSTVGEHFERVRNLLTEPGARLIILNKGLGTSIDINGPGLQQDVDFGPKPQILSWNPIGHTTSVEFEWVVTFAIPDCDNASFMGVSAFNYSMSFDISSSGHTRRRVTGYLEIAMTRDFGANTISDSADNYRELIDIPKAENFEREQSFNLSDDKRRLDFTITDTEIPSPNAYPMGVTRMEGSHQALFNAEDQAWVNYSFSVTIELNQDQPRLLAWELFRQALLSRLNAIPAAQNVMLINLSPREDLFGNTITFDVIYRVQVEENPVTQMILEHGLFTDLGFNWNDWRAGMMGVTGLRGLSDVSHAPEDDQLVDLCNQELPTIAFNKTPYSPGEDPTFTEIQNQKYPPERSYLKWKSYLEETTTYKDSYGVELGPVDVRLNPTGSAQWYNQSTADLNAIQGLGSLENTTAEAAPDMLWTWRGYAERLSYPIPTPDLDNVSGSVVKKTGPGRFVQAQKGLLFGEPLYTAAWNFQYRTTTRPATMNTKQYNPNIR